MEKISLVVLEPFAKVAVTVQEETTENAGQTAGRTLDNGRETSKGNSSCAIYEQDGSV